MQRLTDLLTRAARFTFWPALAFALVMAVLPKPPSLPIDDLGDKFAHMLASSRSRCWQALVGPRHRWPGRRYGFR